MLTANSADKKSVVIERTSPATGTATCTLTFWVEKNQIMLAPAACTGGSAEDHASIEAAVESGKAYFAATAVSFAFFNSGRSEFDPSHVFSSNA